MPQRTDRSNSRSQSATAGAAASTTTQARRRGRKTKLESAEHPYTVAPRADTGRYFMSYSGVHPETGEQGRWKINLVEPGQKMATESVVVAERLAAEIWLCVVQRKAEQRRGETYRGARDFATLAVEYCKFLKQDDERSPDGLKSMRRAIKRTVEYTCLGAEPDVTTLTAKTIRQVHKELQDTVLPPVPRYPRPHHPTTNQIHYILRNIMYMLEWVRQERIPGLENVVHSSGILKRMRRPKRGAHHFYNPIEVAAILRAAGDLVPQIDNLGNPEILNLDFYHGSRSVESLMLRPCDVDFKTGKIRLVIAKQHRYQDGRRKWFDVKTPKDVDRLEQHPVTMWPKLRAILWAYAERHRIFENDWPWFFPDYSARGFKLTDPGTHQRRTKGPYSFLRTAVRHAAKELPGLEYKAFHVARHTYISARRHMYMPVYNPLTGKTEPHPVSLAQIQQEVGHADGSKVTLAVYNKIAYHIPPNTLYDLDWEELAKLCIAAQAAEEARLAEEIALPAAIAAKYAPVASHPALLAELKTPPVAEAPLVHGHGPR